MTAFGFEPDASPRSPQSEAQGGIHLEMQVDERRGNKIAAHIQPACSTCWSRQAGPVSGIGGKRL